MKNTQKTLSEFTWSNMLSAVGFTRTILNLFVMEQSATVSKALPQNPIFIFNRSFSSKKNDQQCEKSWNFQVFPNIIFGSRIVLSNIKGLNGFFKEGRQFKRFSRVCGHHDIVLTLNLVKNIVIHKLKDYS